MSNFLTLATKNRAPGYPYAWRDGYYVCIDRLRQLTETAKVAIMKYKSSEEFHDHLLEAIEAKRSYHLKKFEEGKSDEDKGAVDALAWAHTIIKLGKGNIDT